jgi:hypothetical protein
MPWFSDSIKSSCFQETLGHKNILHSLSQVSCDPVIAWLEVIMTNWRTITWPNMKSIKLYRFSDFS